jgi:hypothetical protein
MQRFTILYPDGSRQKVNATRRDELIVAGSIRQSGNHYLYTGQAKTLHSLADLQQLAITQQPDRRKALPGNFIFELRTKRHHEHLETPEGLALRISKWQQPTSA